MEQSLADQMVEYYKIRTHQLGNHMEDSVHYYLHGYEKAKLKEKENKKMSDQLYKLTNRVDDKGNTAYGTKIATDSSGNAVIEIKGTGEVVAVPVDAIEEVIPWSFSVKFPNSVEYPINTKIYHYWGDKDCVTKGSLLISKNGDIVKVISVDTKSTKANKYWDGWVIPATFIGKEDKE